MVFKPMRLANSARPIDQPPPYGFFQGAFHDPSLGEMAPPPPPPPSPFIEITVGPSPSTPAETTTTTTPTTTSHTFLLRKALLTTHSPLIRTLCASSSNPSLALPSTSPSAFQNFVDYTHSSIYTPNKHARDYHCVQTHLDAWLLGAELHAPAYQTAALNALYQQVEPVARSGGFGGGGGGGGGGMQRSPIRAADVDAVCRLAPPDSLLRAVVFDAVASHWTEADVLALGAEWHATKAAEEGWAETATATATPSWLGVYGRYQDFRARMVNSLKVVGGLRGELLRPAEDYRAGKKRMKEDELWGEESDGGGERGRRTRRRAGSGLVMRARRSSNAGFRRRSHSAGSEDSGSGASAEQETGEEEWMMAG